MASIEELAAMLRSVAKPGMKPKELRAAIRERYPDASRKEVVRAAFYALTDSAGTGQEALADLHGFALAERGGAGGPDTAAEAGKPRKKHRRDKSD